MLSGIDRFLGTAMGSPVARRGGEPPDGGGARGAKAGSSPRPKTLATWKKATAVEGMVVLAVLAFLMLAGPSSEAGPASSEPDVVAAVAAGADADGAVVLASGARVHLLGVEMPTADDPPAVRAAATRGLDRLMQGRHVEIEFDPVLPSRAQRAQRVRVAYVWVLGADGTRKGMANAMMLSNGLARPVTAMGYAHRARFVEAATLAQSRRTGVWQATQAGTRPY